jgi:pyruvate,water dikinase
MQNSQDNRLILWWSEIGLEDISRVGGKNSGLGELVKHLAKEGVRVPEGFALTVDGYWRHLDENNLREPLRILLNEIDVTDIADLTKKSQTARDLIQNAPLPTEIETTLIESYDQLSALVGVRSGPDRRVDVAVRSSATAEDLPEASFAGQQETFLNIRGHKDLLVSVRSCFASLFTDRAIAYRAQLKIDHLQVGLSVGIQRMVRSDLACSGVMFTLDTESGFRDVVLINSSYGLGEAVVQGLVNPDEYMVFKPTLKSGFKPILRRRIGSKRKKIIYDFEGQAPTREEPVRLSDRQKHSLNDHEILALSRWAVAIENHASERAGHDLPMDIEWAKDGLTDELFIIQARPETVHARKDRTVAETYRIKSDTPEPLASGQSVGEKIGVGRARVIKSIKDANLLQKGEILITERTDPDWEPVMKRAAAIVTDHGGRTCHAAIVSRELGIPTVVGTEDGTRAVATGREITVSCAQGDTGYVYDGILRYEIERTEISTLPRAPTKIMMNISDPAEAFRLSALPNDGVGLLRMEFLINHHVGIHPMALLYPERVSNAKDCQIINEKTALDNIKSEYFIRNIAEGVGQITAAFYPKPVILRFSDFKTNEYSHLIGGRDFEPREENPMLGFRGASRYYNSRYREAFALECEAVRRIRDEMGLENLSVMIPFCRTVAEGRKVLAEMNSNGLRQGENGLEVFVMCEIPSNVILADEFADLFDGFSIGSNDLTQLILGIDRESEIVSPLFDEKDPAVLEMISEVIQTAHDHGRKIGICGQAPSDDPDFAAFLIKEGIDSLSLNADAILPTRLALYRKHGGILRSKHSLPQ